MSSRGARCLQGKRVAKGHAGTGMDVQVGGRARGAPRGCVQVELRGVGAGGGMGRGEWGAAGSQWGLMGSSWRPHFWVASGSPSTRNVASTVQG